MSQAIECTECHDMFDIEAGTIEIPYVCETCACDCDTCAMPEPEEDLPVVSCDTASVENTTLLIQDLENQLSNLKSSYQRLREYNTKLMASLRTFIEDEEMDKALLISPLLEKRRNEREPRRPRP